MENVKNEVHPGTKFVRLWCHRAENGLDLDRVSCGIYCGHLNGFFGVLKKTKTLKHTIHYNTNTRSCRLLLTVVIGTSLFAHNHL